MAMFIGMVVIYFMFFPAQVRRLGMRMLFGKPFGIIDLGTGKLDIVDAKIDSMTNRFMTKNLGHYFFNNTNVYRMGKSAMFIGYREHGGAVHLGLAKCVEAVAQDLKDTPTKTVEGNPGGTMEVPRDLADVKNAKIPADAVVNPRAVIDLLDINVPASAIKLFEERVKISARHGAGDIMKWIIVLGILLVFAAFAFHIVNMSMSSAAANAPPQVVTTLQGAADQIIPGR